MSLRAKTIKGVIWNSIELFGGHVIQFLIVIILARLLAPEDFGIIGLLVIFMELSKVVLDSGFSQALIRDQDAGQEDFTSVFYFNVAAGIFVYSVLFFAAPAIGAFYNFPELTNIARVAFLAILINSFGIVQNAKIVRSINFKILAKRTIISNALAGIIAIVMALKGYGVWALVVQSVVAALSRVILLWSFSKWLPSWNFTFQPIKKMLGFSLNLLASGILDVIVSNIQTLLIGKYYTRVDLGYYTQANRLERIPSSTLTSIVRTVTYPILSKIQDNLVVLKQAYRRIIGVSFFLVFPLMLGLMAMGNNFVILLVGEKWAPSVVYFQLLCIVGAIFPLYSINQNIFLVRGNSKMFLKVNVAKRIITLVAIFITIWYSVLALVIGQVVATVINTLITMIYSGREIQYYLKEQLSDLGKIVISTLIMVVAIVLIGKFFPNLNRAALLIIQAGMATISYTLASHLLKVKSLDEVKKIYLEQFKKKSII